MKIQLVNLYLLSPLHTGGTSQEGNIVGVARETHTNFPYAPSSTVRGKLRASLMVDLDNSDPDAKIQAKIKQVNLFGPDLNDLKDQNFIEYYELETDRKLTQLEQGSIWIGDASLLWFPVSSLSHGVIWISCPLLLQRWSRLSGVDASKVTEYKTNLARDTIYLKDAIIPSNGLEEFPDWSNFVPKGYPTSIDKVLVLPNQHCETLIQMSVWRQVKVKLNEHKVVTDGSFRYEEAIPPDTLMYFSWGITTQANKHKLKYQKDFKDILDSIDLLQIGGQESLGRGFVKHWFDN